MFSQNTELSVRITAGFYIVGLSILCHLFYSIGENIANEVGAAYTFLPFTQIIYESFNLFSTSRVQNWLKPFTASLGTIVQLV
jgi:hypothetical protein